MPMINSYRNVDDYIADQPEKIKSMLQKLQLTIIKAAPHAEESISYGMPAYKFHGPLVYFGAFKDHIGFFPTPSGVAHFAEALKKYNTAKGTIHFLFDKPIPVKLVTEIVKFRVQENLISHQAKELSKGRKVKRK
jgi:uncharacterized protein YdhG (YjbR/CyaY superfamily)